MLQKWLKFTGILQISVQWRQLEIGKLQHLLWLSLIHSTFSNDGDVSFRIQTFHSSWTSALPVLFLFIMHMFSLLYRWLWCNV
jgi:hypothetical protein